MPELSRWLFPLLAAVALVGCAGEPGGPPAAGGEPAAARTGGGDGPPAAAGGGDGAAATGADLAELDPEARRRVELWQETMGQIEPCLRPRLSEIDTVEDAGVVAVQVEYDRTGAPVGADLQRDAQARLAENETYRAVVNAILNSVQECAPLADMPAEEFDTWRLFPVVIRPRAA